MNTIESLPKNTKLILFDGVCNLCDGAIQFIIKNDSNRVFRYASLQSKFGKKVLAEKGINPKTTDSIILINPNVAYYVKSTAALLIAKQLGGLYRLFSVFLILPEKFRDIIYDFIARNRYRWFGKKENCMIPNKELKSLFLED